MRVLTALAAALALTGCATTAPPLGEPLQHIDPVGGYRFSGQPPSRRSDDLLLVVTFSGGGARAAALAYGVMRQLAADTVSHDGRPKRLLDEVDVISAVSGGSLPAAYYGLYGDRLFEDFVPRFLQSHIDRRLYWWMFGPRNWFRLPSARVARGDVYAEFLDRELFAGRTFDDLRRAGDRPFVVINATDLAVGARFSFTQETFDSLCLNLGSYSIARAVAASSALPLIVTPIALENRAGRCGWTPPPWYSQALASGDRSSRRYQAAVRLQRYQQSGTWRYLHLADGALSDNLGVRLALEVLSTFDDPESLERQIGLGEPKRVAFIVVNAAGTLSPDIARTPRAPSDLETLRRGTLVPVDLYALESRAAVEAGLREWTRSIGPDGQHPEIYFVEVNFDGLDDAEEAARLKAVPTAVSIEASEVDAIACAGSRVLARQAAYRRLVLDLHGQAPSAAACR